MPSVASTIVRVALPESVSYRRAVSRLIVSCGGLGYLPRGPATAGAILGAGAYQRLRPSPWQRVGLLTVAALVGQALTPQFVSDQVPDPDFVILDEVAGVWAALLAVPSNTYTCGIGVVLFRMLDKLKPGPIGIVERAGGRWSVMADDLLAGFATGLVLVAGRSVVERRG